MEALQVVRVTPILTARAAEIGGACTERAAALEALGRGACVVKVEPVPGIQTVARACRPWLGQ
jgi:hypothetical protein